MVILYMGLLIFGMIVYSNSQDDGEAGGISSLSIRCPLDQMLEVKPGRKFQAFTVPDPDILSGTNVTFTYHPNYFEVGVTEVTFVATDASGNQETCSFYVHLTEYIDNIPPDLTCPMNQIQVVSPGDCYVVLQYPAPNATDDSGDLMILTYPKHGSYFDTCSYYGGVWISVTARDSSGNIATCTFHINWSDRLATMSSPEWELTTRTSSTSRPTKAETLSATTIPSTTFKQLTTTKPVTTRLPTTTPHLSITTRLLTTTDVATTTQHFPTTSTSSTRPPRLFSLLKAQTTRRTPRTTTESVITTKPSTTTPPTTYGKSTTTRLTTDALLDPWLKPMDVCAPNPCRNDGQCLRDRRNTIVSCVCTPGYTGNRCDIQLATAASDTTVTNETTPSLPISKRTTYIIVGFIIGGLLFILCIIVAPIIRCYLNRRSPEEDESSQEQKGHWAKKSVFSTLMNNRLNPTDKSPTDNWYSDMLNDFYRDDIGETNKVNPVFGFDEKEDGLATIKEEGENKDETKKEKNRLTTFMVPIDITEEGSPQEYATDYSNKPTDDKRCAILPRYKEAKQDDTFILEPIVDNMEYDTCTTTLPEIKR